MLINTALESPLGQIAMIPMLAWIANSAPERLKATYFAVMASFTNLALSASQLGTKYLNQIYTVTREVKDAASGAVKVPADYSQLGDLMLTAVALGFASDAAGEAENFFPKIPDCCLAEGEGLRCLLRGPGPPSATASVILRFVARSSSREGMVPSGRGLRGTPAVLMTISEPARTS